jgi:S-sulfo-L-cysteine synthase (O-acetyl-L-serine-dependent)
MTLTQLRRVQVAAADEYGLESRVGNTPLLRMRRLTNTLSHDVRIFAKAEWFNPGGSIKDRAALSIIRAAMRDGHLAPGKRLLDSTSGNMGISYATFGAVLQIPVTLCVPSNASPERIAILKALGAEIILTDPSAGSDGAILEARKMGEAQPDLYWYANQYDNPANWQAHYLTTGPEILDQTNGKITHLVLGLGTSGTLMGSGRYLREQLPDLKIIAVQPDDAFHGLEGLKHMPTAIQPKIYDAGLADRVIEIRTEAAHEMVRELARQEGLFVGISSGAAMTAALQVAGEIEKGTVVTVFPDAGYKYLSDRALWEGK